MKYEKILRLSYFNFIATIGVGCIMVTMTLITIPLMDRIGRRTLHLVGLGGIILCSIMISVALNYSTKKENNNISVNISRDNAAVNETTDSNIVNDGATREGEASGVGIFLVIATLTFVVFFALGPGSIPWMAAGEMFGQGSRAPAISICVFTNWLANLVVSLVFKQLQLYLKNYSFLPFLIITIILFSILFFYFAETKGKTANEVAHIYQAPGAWKSFIGNQKDDENTRIFESSRIELNTTQI